MLYCYFKMCQPSVLDNLATLYIFSDHWLIWQVWYLTWRPLDFTGKGCWFAFINNQVLRFKGHSWGLIRNLCERFHWLRLFNRNCTSNKRKRSQNYQTKTERIIWKNTLYLIMSKSIVTIYWLICIHNTQYTLNVKYHTAIQLLYKFYKPFICKGRVVMDKEAFWPVFCFK